MSSRRDDDPPAPADLSDVELVRSTLGRRPEAVELFVRRMKCVPRMLAVRNLRAGGPLRPGELEDLTQDVLIAVWRRLPAFDGRARLETWVYQFCYLEFLRRLRTRRSSPHPVADSASELEGAAAAPERSALEYEHVHSSLAGLEEREADVLRLKHFEDLTFDEIGGRLGVSPNTAKSRYYRALEKLRRQLGKTRGEPLLEEEGRT